MRLVAAALVMSGCLNIDEPHGSGVVGSPADLHTAPGDYAGFRVVTPCTRTWTDVGVIGTGSVELTAEADIEAAGQDLHARLADFASIWGWGGYSLVCEPGVGTSVDSNNWRDVDAMIERIGDWLREHDYKVQVGVAIGGQPVPVSAD